MPKDILTAIKNAIEKLEIEDEEAEKRIAILSKLCDVLMKMKSIEEGSAKIENMERKLTSAEISVVKRYIESLKED
jgi:hypothetical protein